VPWVRKATCLRARRRTYLDADTADKLMPTAAGSSFRPAAAPPTTVFLLGVGVGSAPGGRMVFWLVRMGCVDEAGAAGLA